MKEKLAELKERYIHAESQKERNAINKEMAALAEEDSVAFSKAMLALARETNERLGAHTAREKLDDILPMVSLTYIAKNYFKRSQSWLYQRVNGSIVNGKRAKFSEEDLETLNYALHDMGHKLMLTRITMD